MRIYSVDNATFRLLHIAHGLRRRCISVLSVEREILRSKIGRGVLTGLAREELGNVEEVLCSRWVGLS